MKDLKIFLGTSEIAGILSFLEKEFKQQGYAVTTCSDNFNSTFYKKKYNIQIRSVFLHRFVSRIIGSKLSYHLNNIIYSVNRWIVFMNHRNKHDVYIFMWDGFLVNSTRDYKYLKKKGKTIITLCLGSDVRYIDAFKQQYNIDVSKWEDWFKKRGINPPMFRLRKAELYSNIIFSLPDQMGLAIRPYNKLLLPFDTKDIEPQYHDRQIPKIVHIPSRTGIKGSDYILDAINKLKEDGYQFEFEFITDVPNETVIQKLKNADILVDEAYLYGPGTLSLEAIACGCAVATKHELTGPYSNVICYIDTENIYEPLKKIITDQSYRIRLSREALIVVKEINDPQKVAENTLKLNMSSLVCPVYYPTFYTDEYDLRDNVVNSANKRLTREVLKKYDSNFSDKVIRLKKERKI